MGGQGNYERVCKNGLYLVQYCPLLYILLYFNFIAAQIGRNQR